MTAILSPNEALAVARKALRELGMIQIGESASKRSTYHSLPGVEWTLRVSDHPHDPRRQDGVLIDIAISRSQDEEDLLKRVRTQVGRYADAAIAIE